MSNDLDPGLYVPEYARQNYIQLAQARADANDSDLKAEWGRLIEEWRRYAEADPAAGYDKIAGWAESVDPEKYGDVTDPEAMRRLRAIESEAKDPRHMISDEDREAAAEQRAALLEGSVAGSSIPTPVEPVEKDEPGGAPAKRTTAAPKAKDSR